MSDDSKSNALSKPLPALRSFSRKLGWKSLRIQQHFSSVDDQRQFGVEPVITWYVTGQFDGKPSDFFFQINEHPIGQTETYCAAVYAMRFRICSGWHTFRIAVDDEAELARLEPWLHRRWFESLTARREYRRIHPECATYSWTRIQKDGPPFMAAPPGRD
jgi:hypothetical protein